MRIFAYLGGKGGLSYRNKILHRGRGPRRNHPCKFWWRSVQGFLRERGSNFPLFHWLALSSLKHSGTTVPACDWAMNVQTLVRWPQSICLNVDIFKIDFSMFNFIFKIKYKILRCIGYLFAVRGKISLVLIHINYVKILILAWYNIVWYNLLFY